MGNLCITKETRINQIITEDKINHSKYVNPQKAKKDYESNDIDHLITLQSYLKMKYIKKRYREKVELLSSVILKKINANKVIDQEKYLLNNRGEQLYRKLLFEGKCEKILDIQHRYKLVITTELVSLNDKSNDCYIGSWNLNELYHGYGILYKNNSKLEGLWENGILNGKGRIFHSNGDYFLGNFLNGMAKGNGTILHSNQIEYLGNWIDDYPNGNGKEIYSDGSTFEGVFINGHKTKGRFAWNDGCSFEGDIDNDMLNGYGVYIWANNKKYEGEWVQGQMTGKGKMLFEDGCVYIGEFLNNQFEGQGQYIWNSKKYYQGNWKKGKQNGSGAYYKDGILTEGIWSSGKLINTNIKLSTPMPINQIKQNGTSIGNEISITPLVHI